MNKKKNTLNNIGTFLLFAGPATLAFLAVVIIPFLYGFYLTFTSWDGVSKSKPFVGLQNYISVIGDTSFWRSLGLTLLYVAISVVLVNVVGFLLALLVTGKIKGKNVVSDGTYWAHCRTLREGVADLLYKHAADRGAEQYRHLTLDSVLPFDEAVTMYRVITGACQAGTQQFIERLPELKEAYSVREMIELTRGQYGADKFAEFFGA